MVVILGGTGKMGQWFAKFLKNKDFDVAIHSRSMERAAKVAAELQVNYISSLDELQKADIVIVSTSLASTAETVRQVATKMKPNTILFDIASVKGDIIEALQSAKSRGIRAISIHPMFGPGASSIKDKHVLIVPIGDDPMLINEIQSLFNEAETHIINNGEIHDTLISLTLSLPHFLNIIFGKILSITNIHQLLKCAGTTFALQLLLTEAVYSEDPDLYYEIQSQNTVFQRNLDSFLASIQDVALTIKQKDRETFVKNFREVKAFLAADPNFSKAYNRFYKAYEATV